MCNAWNHSPGCDCGWGGSGTGGWRGGDRSIYGLSTISSHIVGYSKILGDYKSSFSAKTEDAETYPTECWRCGTPVYYHTNGYGDSVLFDSLGWPWQVHDCWRDYWTAEKARRELAKPVVLRNLESDQLKRLVLAGAIQKLRNNGFKVTEEQVATYMGTLIEQLRQEYSRIYELYMENGLVQMRLK